MSTHARTHAHKQAAVEKKERIRVEHRQMPMTAFRVGMTPRRSRVVITPVRLCTDV